MPAPSRYAQRPSAEALAPASPLLAGGAPPLGSAGVSEAEPIPQAVSPQDTGALVADIAAELMAGSPSAASTGDGLRPA